MIMSNLQLLVWIWSILLSFLYFASIIGSNPTTYSGFYHPSLEFNYEAYAGAWLVSTKRFLKSADNILTISNLEGATLSTLSDEHTLMTRDYFDFFVTHLSSTLNEIGDFDDHGMQEELLARIHYTIDALKREISHPNTWRNKPFQEHTLVLIPFSTISGSMYINPNDTQKTNFNTKIRYLFLSATVWSIYRYFPKIIIGCFKKDDISHIETLSLPFWKIVDLSKEVTNPIFLPKYTLIYALNKLNQTQFIDKSSPDYLEWSKIRFIYYSESDQVVYARNYPKLIEVIGIASEEVPVVPHRMQTIALPKTFYNQEKR